MGIMHHSWNIKKVDEGPWDQKTLFCHELPTQFRKDIGTVLVSGASGYIGGRLVLGLLTRGYKVRVMVRGRKFEYYEKWPTADIVEADALDRDQLIKAFEGIDTAYYLIHSLLLGPDDFAAVDIQAAINFREAAEKNGLKRIIYMGGLGDTLSLSEHLKSRMEVAEELQKGTVPVTVLRAAIIIGSGSASYEIIKHLVLRLPLLPIPRWARNRCQPISIRDVLKYLVGVLENVETVGKSYDIGGQDILSYKQMMQSFSRIMHKRRFFLDTPEIGKGVYAYFASLLTPVPAPITYCLMEGTQDEVICTNDDIKRCLPFEPLDYKESILRAMTREEQDSVYTRWSDAYPPAHSLAIKLHELRKPPRYSTTYLVSSEKNARELFDSICKIGGKDGWFHGNWMWRLRGWVDKLMLGVGSSRGRKSRSRLQIGDVIDFWRIEDLELDQRLLLRAEMKLPGKAWLEFNLTHQHGHRLLSVTAWYATKSFFGKLYWYIFLPFHHFIFKGLLEQIIERSQPVNHTGNIHSETIDQQQD